MTSLQKATAYLKRIGPKAALAIVPLAAAALPAKASLLVFAPDLAGGWTSSVEVTGGASSLATTPLAGSEIQGIKMIGSRAAPFFSGGGIFVDASWSGTGAGSTIPFPTSTLAVKWVFSATDGFDDALGWFVKYTINGVTTTVSGSTPVGGGPISGSGTIPVTAGANLSTWNIEFRTTWANFSGGVANVSVTDISFLPTDLAAAPEPSCLLLGGPGLAWLILRRRKARR